jgi:carbonic anhydrase
MYQQGLSRFLPFIITISLIVYSNLLTGILIGLFFSFFFILRDNSRIQLNIINEKHPHGVIKRIVLPQQMSFLSKASLVKTLDKIPSDINLIIDARYTKYIDRDICEVINVFQKKQAPYKRIALNLLGFKKVYEIQNRNDFLNVTTYDTQSSLTPQEVLDLLREGNKRFVKDKRIYRSLLDDLKATSNTQHPLAIILSCIDSRVPVETIFDMGIGDLFVVRIAGNIINDDILGSMEFACHQAGAKLIVVLGHTFCGAINAACDDGSSSYLGDLLRKIEPAVEAETQTVENRNSRNKTFVTNVTKININNSVKLIRTESAVLKQLIDDKSIKVVGALYDLHSGKVKFNV